MRLRSPYDREIYRLALPALGALAAEPLYLLADTAMVGHLGTPELAALALAGTLLTGAFTLFNFLTYGTTAQVARLHGAGREEAAGRIAAQALWLSAGIGICLTALLVSLASPLVHLLGGEGRTGDLAVTYLRIGSLGLPFALIALAGQGCLRGVSDLRTPLVIVVVANVVNVVLNLVFIYGFGWGLEGSAWATVDLPGGDGRGVRAPAAARPGRLAEPPSLGGDGPLGRIGGQIFVRTAALYGSFLVASAVLARIGEDSLAAHLIAFQLFVFLALVLDSVAIAGQVIVGRALGAGDAEGARRAARRMIEMGRGGRRGVRPRDARAHRRSAARVHRRPEGRRPGAGDLAAVRPDAAGQRSRVRARRHPDRRGRHPLPDVGDAGGRRSAPFVPIALLSLALDLGIVGVWVGLLALIAVRLITCGFRFRGGRWAVIGAVRTEGAAV